MTSRETSLYKQAIHVMHFKERRGVDGVGGWGTVETMTYFVPLVGKFEYQKKCDVNECKQEISL